MLIVENLKTAIKSNKNEKSLIIPFLEITHHEHLVYLLISLRGAVLRSHLHLCLPVYFMYLSSVLYPVLNFNGTQLEAFPHNI